MKQAIAVEKAGKQVDFQARRDLEHSEELTEILKKDGTLAKAFNALTPGRQRSYVVHFTSAKQSKTRVARIEKSIPKILAGKVCTIASRKTEIACDRARREDLA